MDQKFEGQPHAEIRLDGHKVTRSDVTHDWGLRLQWQISRDGKVLTILGKGVKVKILEPGETWTKIDLNGKPGWIGTRLLTASIE